MQSPVFYSGGSKSFAFDTVRVRVLKTRKHLDACHLENSSSLLIYPFSAGSENAASAPWKTLMVQLCIHALFT